LPGCPRWADAGDPLLALPKVSLHDRLDGSLRPESMLELADAEGVGMPYSDAADLSGWFQGLIAEPAVDNWDEKFGLTTALMQTPENLARMAYEFVLDLAAGGVVYGETRWAPEQHTLRGMSPDTAVAAVTDGLAAGEQAARRAGFSIRVRQLLCAMRTSLPDRGTEIAALTARHPGARVAGFDLAGEESGHPASERRRATAARRGPGAQHPARRGTRWARQHPRHPGQRAPAPARARGAQRGGHPPRRPPALRTVARNAARAAFLPPAERAGLLGRIEAA
jgi:adenosine deaminase